VEKRDIELKLPDHVLHRKGNRIGILERESGARCDIQLPVEASLRRQTSPRTPIAALATGVFAYYFSMMFTQELFANTVETTALVVLMIIPFLVGPVGRARTAVLAYLAAFLAFAALRGGLMGQLRLGVIFFGDGPISPSGYALVPASSLLAALLIGLVPYLVYRMMGQVAVTYRITIPSGNGHCDINLRDRKLVRETLALFRDAEGPTAGADQDTSI
jgi:hypothetical protein